MFKYTVVQAIGNKLNKSFDIHGKKTSNAHLSYGAYQVEEVNSVKELLQRFKTLKNNEAIIQSISKNGKLSGTICSRGFEIPEAITRTKEDFSFNGNHILCFDYDPCTDGYMITSPEHYVQVLKEIDPALKNCEIGVTFGSSYGLHNGATCINNKLSLHAYTLICNATDENVQEYKESLKNSCWKLGYGHVKISSSGASLQRQIFDDVVLSPERLLFEAVPTLADGLSQIKPDDYIVGSGARDLNDIQSNDGEGKALFEKAKEEKAPEAKTIRDKYIEAKTDELVKKQDYSQKVAKEIVIRRVEDGVLAPDDILYSKDKGAIKVSEILLSPEHYQNLSVLDPINPKDNEYVAMVYVNEHSIVCHSFKSGGVNYRLVANESVLEKLCETAENKGDTENKKFASKIVALCDGAGIEDSKRKDFAIALKSKKIVSSVNHLNTKAMKVAFPDVKYVGDEVKLLNTIDNLKIFLEYKNVDVKYDEILKEGIITGGEGITQFNDDTDDKVNSQFTKLRSECIKIGLPEKIVQDNLPAIIDDNSYNPIMEMVLSKPWDGVDRISEIISCLKSDDEFYVKQVITLWLLQCVAAWDYIKSCPIKEALARFENVLVFVGNQGLSKTKFFEGLLPQEFRKYVAAGIHLDTHQKDSVKLAICSAICELGELDSTFTKDIGALKAFISLPVDKFRLPYARSESSFRRRTSFCASVNDTNFLVDPTGNRRFWPVELEAIDYAKFMKIDKQQLWANVYSIYLSGEKWWVDANVDTELYATLNKKHNSHMIVTPVDDILEKVIRDTLEPVNNANYSNPLNINMPIIETSNDHTLVWKTATEIATHFHLPSNKRGITSTIKKELSKAGIEQKGNIFRVRLVS